MVASLIKFTQGPNTDLAGRAVKGTLASVDGAVAVSNDDNTDVVSWQVLMLDAPADSAYGALVPYVLASAASATPAASFSPDAPGSYRIMLDVLDGSGQRDRDIRCFGVPSIRGVIAPPYQKNPDPLPVPPPGIITPIASPADKPDEQNYGGQSRGWKGSSTGDGQLDAFFTVFDDLPVKAVTATPYTTTESDGPQLLVDTSSIGSDVTINLTEPRTGKQWRVAHRMSAAATTSYKVVVALPGGSFFPDGSSSMTLLPGENATFIYRGSTAWVAIVDRHPGVTPLFGDYTTPNSTPVALIVYPVATNHQHVVIDLLVTARDETTGDVAGWSVIGVFKNEAGVVTQLGATSILAEERDDPSWSVDFAISGTNVEFRVTGDAANSVKWRGDGRAVSRSA